VICAAMLGPREGFTPRVQIEFIRKTLPCGSFALSNFGQEIS